MNIFQPPNLNLVFSTSSLKIFFTKQKYVHERIYNKYKLFEKYILYNK